MVYFLCRGDPSHLKIYDCRQIETKVLENVVDYIISIFLIYIFLSTSYRTNYEYDNMMKISQIWAI